MTAALGTGGAADVAMLDCLREYRSALGVLAAVESEPDPDPDQHLCASEAVIAARTRMAHHLVSTGWTPPADIAASLALDGDLATESNGALGG